MLQEKLNALKTYLLNNEEATEKELKDLTGKNCYNDVYDTFEVGDNEYKVFTDDEADEAAAEEIKSNLWAFNADFIIEHTNIYDELTTHEYNALVEALQKMQADLCETANPLVMALIDNIDGFASDAIYADGRGAFLSFYDGIENEENGFYIYRIN